MVISGSCRLSKKREGGRFKNKGYLGLKGRENGGVKDRGAKTSFGARGKLEKICSIMLIQLCAFQSQKDP
jgi:hypothetical protein